MRRGVAPAAVLAAIVLAPLGVVAPLWSHGGTGAWVVLHACAHAVAVAASLPMALLVALAASMWGLALLHGARQAVGSVRAVRLARRHEVSPSPDVRALSRRLGITRLVVADLPGKLAYCAGLLRPRVVVGSSLVEELDRPALEAVLAHEAAHARSRDPLRQIVVHAAARGLWMVPVAARVADHHRLRLELAADRRAVRVAGRRALARALLAFHGEQHAVQPAIAGGASALAARIDALVEGSTAPKLLLDRAAVTRSLGGVAATALVLLLVVASPGAGPNPLLPMPMTGSGVGEMVVAWILRGVAVAVAWGAVHLLLTRRRTAPA